MRYRIAIIEYHNPFCGMKQTYAVQAKPNWISGWVTVGKCESLSQAKCMIRHKREDNPEKLIRVLKGK